MTQSGLEEANSCVWVLTCVELDRSLMCNAGNLPIYRRSDGYSFGREPVAIGTMQGSTEGLWSVNVRFKEPPQVPPEQRGMANAAVAAGLALGPAVGTLTGGLIVATLGWRAMFIVFGVATLL